MLKSYRNQNFKVLFDEVEKKYSIRPHSEPTPSNLTDVNVTGPIEKCIDYVNRSLLLDNIEAGTPPDKVNFLGTFTAQFVINNVNKLLWFSLGGRDKRPIFFDLKSEYPELSIIDSNFSIIKNELEKVMKLNLEIPKFHEADPAQSSISQHTRSSWRTFYLYSFGEKPVKNRTQCPETSKILDSIPNIQQAFFSILGAGKSIPPHYGPYAGVTRYHLALTVPNHNPPSIRLHDQIYTWETGQSVMFDDTWNHEVINESNETRIILFIDVKRKLKFPFNLINSITLHVMGSKYGKSIRDNLKWNR